MFVFLYMHVQHTHTHRSTFLQQCRACLKSKPSLMMQKHDVHNTKTTVATWNKSVHAFALIAKLQPLTRRAVTGWWNLSSMPLWTLASTHPTSLTRWACTCAPADKFSYSVLS